MTCKVCGKKVPVWPAGWRFTDDGDAFCPGHKGRQGSSGVAHNDAPLAPSDGEQSGS